MDGERDHKVPVSPGAERSPAPAAGALRGGALERGRALPEGDPIVLELGGGALGHDANDREAPLGEPGGLAAHLSAQVDREAPADGRTDGGQVGPGAQMVRVGPSGLQIGGCISQHPQQIATDHTPIVPEIPGHVVTEPGARLQVADGRNEVHLGQATGAGGHGIPVEAGVVSRIGVAKGLGGAALGAAATGRGAHRDGASLVVARLESQCSVHRVLSAS